MELIATQGETRWLIWRQGKADLTQTRQLVVIVDRSAAESHEVPLGSALARGYWDEPTEQPDPDTLARWLNAYRIEPWPDPRS